MLLSSQTGISHGSGKEEDCTHLSHGSLKVEWATVRERGQSYVVLRKPSKAIRAAANFRAAFSLFSLPYTTGRKFLPKGHLNVEPHNA